MDKAQNLDNNTMNEQRNYLDNKSFINKKLLVLLIASIVFAVSTQIFLYFYKQQLFSYIVK